jgi:hypothetical protein
MLEEVARAIGEMRGRALEPARAALALELLELLAARARPGDAASAKVAAELCAGSCPAGGRRQRAAAAMGLD